MCFARQTVAATTKQCWWYCWYCWYDEAVSTERLRCEPPCNRAMFLDRSFRGRGMAWTSLQAPTRGASLPCLSLGDLVPLRPFRRRSESRLLAQMQCALYTFSNHILRVRDISSSAAAVG